MFVLPQLFLGFPFMTIEQILIAIPLQACIKTLYESLIVPVTMLIVKKVRNYENNLNKESVCQ